jgi:hypothetical protein
MIEELLSQCSVFRFVLDGETAAVIDCPSMAIAKKLAINYKTLLSHLHAFRTIRILLLGRDLYPILSNPS